jgi:hypothetical protein
MKLNRLLFLIVLLHQYGFAQPATEVYLLDIQIKGNTFSIVPNSNPKAIQNDKMWTKQ